MFDCNNLIHPFQHDPGTSQAQRTMEELLSGPAKIDGRTLADLLDYFVQISSDINFYSPDLTVQDWRPFFQGSLPFLLSSIIKFDADTISDKFDLYNTAFTRSPSDSGIQLSIYFTFYNSINKINGWYSKVKGSGLPIEAQLQKLIKDKLQQPLKNFICLTNAAVKWFCVRKIDFTFLSKEEAWGLDLTDLFCTDEGFLSIGHSKRKQLLSIQKDIATAFSSFLEGIRLLPDFAENCLQQSLIPLKAELQKKHTPHLALIFVFLDLFQKLQDDLNGYTKKHLDFFYKDVLQLKARGAVPDKANIIFELQNQVKKYLVKKGITVKAGKDNNKAEILFGLDEEIVVNRAQVTDTRTLFLNYQNVQDTEFLEGVYMAPVATMADGIDKEFKDDQPHNFPTIGSKLSKYIKPGTTFYKPYPNARMGFILASPVLLMHEGKRSVTITLVCQLDEQLCVDPSDPDPIPKIYEANKLFNKVRYLIRKNYVLVSGDLINTAAAKGIQQSTIDKLWTLLLEADQPDCCGNDPIHKYKYEDSFTWGEWWLQFRSTIDASEAAIIDELFPKINVFKLSFSGEKGWVYPSKIERIRLTPLTAENKFAIKIKATLKADKDPISFFDKKVLNEDYNTTQPVVKIEINDHIKIKKGFDLNGSVCCMENKVDPAKYPLSYYHFFRYLRILDTFKPDGVTDLDTGITVRVCGFKNFIVQNDESVQDVNAPIYPFGTRPNVPDFDVVNPIANPKNLIGPSFYIGSSEVLGKKWTQIYVNLNWKGKPSDFRDYYKAYAVDKVLNLFGLDDQKFEINLGILQDGKWIEEDVHGGVVTTIPAGPPQGNNRRLFDNDPMATFCVANHTYDRTILFENDFFTLDQKFSLTNEKVTRLNVDSKNGFLKINLQKQDFCHKNYPFVLARQMLAFGKLPQDHVEGAIYYDSIAPPPLGSPVIFDSSKIVSDIQDASTLAGRIFNDVNNAGTGVAPNLPAALPLTNTQFTNIANDVRGGPPNLVTDSTDIQTKVNEANTIMGTNLKFQAIIPNEPWTPVISYIDIDYVATAKIDDIDLIHLYPYDGTYKSEEIELQPTLVPTFCDEGTLLIGLKDLVPGANLNILFQLAEATSDSEADPQDAFWYYLDNNEWKPLRTGFEIIEDATENLTTSGIIEFSIPDSISNKNTVMPAPLYWIKAALPKNSSAVSETIGIHTQAIEATFTDDQGNDELRLAQALAPGSISKLEVADSNIKQVSQPYDSFSGALPEMQSHFYVRISELLRHKGRAIQKFDYERLVLEAFPDLFKVKCINHSFALNAHRYYNDFPLAPGYVILAVIPDLNKLKAGNSFEPKAPLSVLEKVNDYIRTITSPFVRYRTMNPRYEKINFCISIKLLQGKDPQFYKEKLKQDLAEFLAPWSIGQFDKLSFGQCVNRSDIIRFFESLDYIDYIIAFRMEPEVDDGNICPDPFQICPRTPRSILVAGNIEVCIPDRDCDEWGGNPCEHEPEPIKNFCEDPINNPNG